MYCAVVSYAALPNKGVVPWLYDIHNNWRYSLILMHFGKFWHQTLHLKKTQKLILIFVLASKIFSQNFKSFINSVYYHTISYIITHLISIYKIFFQQFSFLWNIFHNKHCTMVGRGGKTCFDLRTLSNAFGYKITRKRRLFQFKPFFTIKLPC